MPTYYQYEHPDYGWMTYDLEGLMEELKNDIDCNSSPPDELLFVIKVVEMSQENYEALPTTDEIDEGRYGR